MPGKWGVSIFKLGIGRGAIAIVLKFELPGCGKGEESGMVEVMPERRYRMEYAKCDCILHPDRECDAKKCDRLSEG